jgi:hypothetical protein
VEQGGRSFRFDLIQFNIEVLKASVALQTKVISIYQSQLPRGGRWHSLNNAKKQVQDTHMLIPSARLPRQPLLRFQCYYFEDEALEGFY